MDSASRLTRLLVNLAVEPGKAVQQPGERRQARLISTILLVLIVLILPLIFAFKIEAFPSPQFLIFVEIAYLILYGISRSRRYHWAAGALIFLQAIAPVLLTLFGGPLVSGEMAIILISNCVALQVCIMFFSIQVLFGLGIFNLLVNILIITFQGMTIASQIAPVILNLSISSLVIVAGFYRNQVEKDRLAGLSKTNQDLELMRARLEERVADRTQELQKAYDTIQVEHEELLKSERLATLGRLTAGIAHEINTPLAASRAALVEIGQLANEYLDFDRGSAGKSTGSP